jgi:hypothetical protein
MIAYRWKANVLAGVGGAAEEYAVEMNLPGEDWSSKSAAAYVTAEFRRRLDRLVGEQHGGGVEYRIEAVEALGGAPPLSPFQGVSDDPLPNEGKGVGPWHHTKG